MRRIFRLLLIIVLSIASVESKAQLANGSIAPDFTFKDITGHSYHLYEMLDSGKTIFINVSTAWSQASWLYHHSRNLDSLYIHYGPDSVNVLNVLFIEAELTNTSSQLYGFTTSLTNDGLSRGNFVAGTPFPIIDLSDTTIGATTFLGTSGYNIHSYPTIYMICPDRSVTVVGQQSTDVLYADKLACSNDSVVEDAELIQSESLNNALATCDSVMPVFRIANMSRNPLNHLSFATITYKVDGVTQKVFRWNGNLTKYQSALITGVNVGANTAGDHIITAIVSSPNGVLDSVPANDTAYASFKLFPSTGGPIDSTDFETTGIPSSWVITNGGDPFTWENYGSGLNSLASARLRCYFITEGDVDMFTLDPVSFRNITSPGLTFDVSYASFSPTDMDKLEVQVSHNCGQSWVTCYSKQGSGLATHAVVNTEYHPSSAADWRNELVRDTVLTGEDTMVLIRFKATSGYGNDIYVDNINMAASAGINENFNASSINVYPNPASDICNVSFNLSKQTNVSISLTNIIGSEIKRMELGNLPSGETNYPLNTEGMNSGLYFITLQTSSGSFTKKLAVNR